MDSLTEEVEAGLVKTGEIADQVIPAMTKFVEKISPVIATVAERLGTTAEHLWVIFVKQSYNHAIGNGIIIIFAFIGLYIAFYCTKIWKKKIDDEGWSNEGLGGIIAVRAGASVICTIIITNNILNLVHRLINPEYYALQTVLSYIK